MASFVWSSRLQASTGSGVGLHAGGRRRDRLSSGRVKITVIGSSWVMTRRPRLVRGPHHVARSTRRSPTRPLTGRGDPRVGELQLGVVDLGPVGLGRPPRTGARGPAASRPAAAGRMPWASRSLSRSKMGCASASWASSRARLAWAWAELHLEGTRIDHDEEVSLAHVLPFAEGHLDDLPVHPGLDGHGVERRDRAEAGEVDGQVAPLGARRRPPARPRRPPCGPRVGRRGTLPGAGAPGHPRPAQENREAPDGPRASVSWASPPSPRRAGRFRRHDAAHSWAPLGGMGPFPRRARLGRRRQRAAAAVTWNSRSFAGVRPLIGAAYQPRAARITGSKSRAIAACCSPVGWALQASPG